MLIVCPNCASSYEVQPGNIGPAGRSVRCARCRMVWFAAAPSAPPMARDAQADAAAESMEPPEGPATAEERVEGGEFNWSFTLEQEAQERAKPPSEEVTATASDAPSSPRPG